MGQHSTVDSAVEFAPDFIYNLINDSKLNLLANKNWMTAENAKDNCDSFGKGFRQTKKRTRQTHTINPKPNFILKKADLRIC
jgi:hypothetical protein